MMTFATITIVVQAVHLHVMQRLTAVVILLSLASMVVASFVIRIVVVYQETGTMVREEVVTIVISPGYTS